MNISKILLFSPLFAFSYFLRLGESSFYLFDIWFILFFLFTFRSFGTEDLKKLFIFIFSFVFITLLGLVNGLINYTNNFEIAKYFSGLYRYLQFIYILLFIWRVSRVIYGILNECIKPLCIIETSPIQINFVHFHLLTHLRSALN